jgi:hypothetical protein
LGIYVRDKSMSTEPFQMRTNKMVAILILTTRTRDMTLS